MANWTSADIERLKNRKQQAPGATGQKRFQALGRLKAGTMNKTEAAYANLLEARKHTGEIIWYSFEPINIRLAKNTFYKVDFLVMTRQPPRVCFPCKVSSGKQRAGKFPHNGERV